MNKKGAILIMVMIFFIIAAIASMGLYTAVYNLGKAQGVGEVEHVKGYFAALGGLRYAKILLKDPDAIDALLTNNYSDSDGNGITLPNPISLKQSYSSVATDLNLTGNRDVSINIVKYSSGIYNGQYKIIATYRY